MLYIAGDQETIPGPRWYGWAPANGHWRLLVPSI